MKRLLVLMFRMTGVQIADIPKIKDFTDREIGSGYFSQDIIAQMVESSFVDGTRSCSLVLKDEAQNIVGLRLTLPPKAWPHFPCAKKMHPDFWPCSPDKVAYFQSLFISENARGQRWGQELSKASVDVLRTIGVKAVICHSWDESPGNSSRTYLDNFGFRPLTSIKNFWHDVDYNCTRCGKPCVCTATEMVCEI